MIRDKDWFNHAQRCLTNIKEFRQTSCLGQYTPPGEYMDLIEDFMKLFYGINEIPEKTIEVFNKAKKEFESFKNDISNLCDILLKEAEKSTH